MDEFDNSGFDNSGRRHFAARRPVAGHNERWRPRVGGPGGSVPIRAAARGTAVADAEEEPGYVIHLPVRVGTAERAVHLAYTLAAALAELPEVDPGDTTVSTVDDQNNRRRVFCDAPLPDRSRCARPFAHPGTCGQP